MAKMVHSMIRVLNEEQSLQFYKTCFGLEVADRIEFETFSLIYLKNNESDFELELTVNKGTAEAYDLGTGYGHLAFIVDDIEKEHKRISDSGFLPRDIVDFQNDGKRIAKFFFIADPDGYQIEVIEFGGRFK